MSLAFDSDADTSLMTANQFRAFYATRPEQERWELIAGVPIMMTPPTFSHQRIGSNFERLLNDAMADHRPDLTALQRSGVVIDDNEYWPEPDIVVVDADFDFTRRYSDRVYLLGEVVSGTDRIPVPGRPIKWIDVKRDLYRAHQACEAIILIEQDRFDVTIDRREGDDWTTAHISDPLAKIDLPMFGLSCQIRDLYKGTPLYRPARK